MKSPRLPFLAAALGIVRGQQFLCDIPTNGCSNGMFNQAACECQCIPPFCADQNGDCVTPSNDCGEVKWKGCTRGVNCPWWVNSLKAESCTTGPDVPRGIWKIWSTREACCDTNFAHSDVCDFKLGNQRQPTRYPTIAAPEGPELEVIPMKFDVMGLPSDISMRDLKDEMMTILRRVLIRMSERISGLKISSIEEKVVLGRNLEKVLRSLQGRDVTLYYNVYVLRDEDKKFGPLIIAEIRDSYNDILNQIQTMSDTFYFGSDLNLNFCTSRAGKFDNCAREGYQPSNNQPSTSLTIQNSSGNGSEVGGLPGWAIALIVIIIILLLACLVIFIFWNCCRKSNDDGKEVQNNIYLEKKSTLSVASSVSLPPRRFVTADFDDESITAWSSRREGRDPTMYYPGDKSKPDPASNILVIKQYGEDPPVKLKRKSSRDPSMHREGDPPVRPKRDPTFFVQGRGDPSMYVEGRKDPSMYVEGRGDPSMYVEGRKDPSMYVEGRGDPSMYVDGRRDPTMYVQGRRDPTMRGSEEDSAANTYDSHGFKRGSVFSTSNRNGTRGGREPSHYETGTSEESLNPSVNSKSPKSKKKKKKVKVKDNGSLQSGWDDWGSAPDVSERNGSKTYDFDRQVKSFFK